MIIPHDNASDLKEIPENIKADLKISPVKWIDEVLEIALEAQPKPLSESEFVETSGSNNVDLANQRPSTH